MSYHDDEQYPDCMKEITDVACENIGRKEFIMLCHGSSVKTSKTRVSDSYRLAIVLANASIEMDEWRFAQEILRRFFDSFSEKIHLFTTKECEEIEDLHDYIRGITANIPRDENKLF